MKKLLSAILTAASMGFFPLSSLAQTEWRLMTSIKPDGAGPWPSVVLVHGCGGIQDNIAMWQNVLRDAGFASMVLDGFSQRGIREICTDFRRLPATTRIQDAFEALLRVQEDPALDINRVAIMGFSNGAIVAFDAANERTLRRYGDAPKFRASVALYPECRMRTGTQFGIPIFIGIGAKDDWTLASNCKAVFDYLVVAAQPGTHVPRLEIYPDAHHAFDTPGLPRGFHSQVININSPSGYGATTEGNPGATEKAISGVLDFLRKELR